MNNDEPNTLKSYNVDNDLPRGKEFTKPMDANINDADVNISDIHKSKEYNQESNPCNSKGEPTNEEEPTVIDDVARYLAIGEQSILLLKELGTLATLELTRSLEAVKISIVLQILLLPAIFLLYISFALSITYIVHAEFESVYLTVITLLLSQIIGIIIVKHKIKKVKKYIGFQQTSKQIYEVKNELLKSIKQTN